MAITLPYTFVPGAARSGAEVNANLEAVRMWLNGQITAADVPVDSVNYQHIVRPEHFGHPMIASLGTMADVYGRRATYSRAERVCCSREVGGNDYVMVPELSATVYVERASWLRIRARFYAWSPYYSWDSMLVPNQEYGVCAFARLFVGTTGITSTTRRIAIHDYANYGVWPNDKKEYSLIYSDSMAAGRYDISVKVRVVANPTESPPLNSYVDPINDGGNVGWLSGTCRFIHIETRSFTVEIDPKFI